MDIIETFKTFDEERIEQACSKVGYHFRIRCLVPRDIPPRDPMFEYWLELGASVYDAIFNGKSSLPILSEAHLFVFPERHLTIQEQRRFLHILNKNAQEVKEVLLITSSPIILADCPKDTILIIHKEQEDNE